MKRISAIALLTIATLITAGSAVAADHAVKADVPFDFTVGDKLLPAGTYTIVSEDPNMVEIRNSERTISVMNVALADGNEPSTTGELVFDRFGDKYFLSQILCPAASIRLHLPTSKIEKRARSNEAMLHDSGQTLVAAK
jgi:hypothetical protein